MKIKIFLLLILLSLGACDDVEYKGPPKFVLYIQDAPARELGGVYISIASVELFDGTNWIKVNSFRTRFDLMSYNGYKMMQLVSSEVPEGKYTQLKITFSDLGNQLVYEGKVFPLTFPLDDLTKTLECNVEASKNTQSIVVVDISVPKSVVKSGEDFLFVPSMSIVDLSLYGAVGGTVVDVSDKAVKDFVLVEAVREDGLSFANYITKGTGKLFMRLPKGKYKLTITPPVSMSLQVKEIDNVVVDQAQFTNVGLVKMDLLDQ